ncbi:putative endopolygalacturonase [Bacillus sp. TS-2]|nr:putative endopolygalacturonase [Bacillus sp. TS-2]
MNVQLDSIELPNIPEQDFNIIDQGAKYDDVFNNQKSIQDTINICAQHGGGRVLIPAGIWVTGPLQLRSKVNLHLEKGATLLFHSHFEQYPLISSSFEGEPTIRCQSPIDGENLEDISITGEGVIDGGGEAWRPVKKFKMTEKQWETLIGKGGVIAKNSNQEEVWWPSEAAYKGSIIIEQLKAMKQDVESYQEIREFLRPNLISLRKCKRILLDGPTFQQSPAWNIHPWFCENVTVRNVHVKNPWYSQNGDGIDIESCKNVLVEHSIFDVGDDAMCIKSGKNEIGRRLNRPSENIWIQHCKVFHGHGGFVVGSEMSGGVKNVSISHCQFYGTDTGLRFKSSRERGGLVENLFIANITMVNIQKEAIVFQMDYEQEGQVEKEYKVTEKTPTFREIEFKNIVCHHAGYSLVMKGLKENRLEGIRFEQLNVKAKKGVLLSNCKDIEFINCSFETEETQKIWLISNCELVQTNNVLLNNQII